MKRSILDEIEAERDRQDARWGVQTHPFDHPDAWWQGVTTRDAAQRRCGDYEIPSEDRAKFLCENEDMRGTLTWPHILIEEVSEAVSAAGDPVAMRAELVQVAAVAAAMIEALDRAAE